MDNNAGVFAAVANSVIKKDTDKFGNAGLVGLNSNVGKVADDSDLSLFGNDPQPAYSLLASLGQTEGFKRKLCS